MGAAAVVLVRATQVCITGVHNFLSRPTSRPASYVVLLLLLLSLHAARQRLFKLGDWRSPAAQINPTAISLGASASHRPATLLSSILSATPPNQRRGHTRPASIRANRSPTGRSSRTHLGTCNRQRERQRCAAPRTSRRHSPT